MGNVHFLKLFHRLVRLKSINWYNIFIYMLCIYIDIYTYKLIKLKAKGIFIEHISTNKI